MSKELADLIELRNITKKKKSDSLDEQRKKEQIKKWTTFYRRNVNIYASERLKIKLHPFQHVMLYLMGVSQVFFAICSRGSAKTFVVALYAICKSMLFPFSEIVITSSTREQAKKMVQKKMENELCKKLSPVLKYLYKQKQITFTYNQDEIVVDFVFNDSKIIVLPCIESSRGERSVLNIYEEARLLKKGLIDSIFEKMHHPRQSLFLNKPEYAGNPIYLEESQSIYITSAGFKTDWIWRAFKNVVNGCFMSSQIPYNFFASDIFLAMHHGLKTKSDLVKAKNESSDLELRMEDYNEMIGEAQDAYFKLEKLRANQILHKAFRPPTVSEYNERSELKNNEKKSNECRILAVDFAFANTTNSRQENDNTVLECVSVFFDGQKCCRNLDYIETCDGGDSIGTERKIRELFWDYQVDYIVLDLKSGGEVYYNNLTKEFIHPERSDKFWNSHGFTVCGEMDLQVLQQAKINDLVSRTVDPQAIPVIIPIEGSAQLNSNIWLDLSRCFNDGTIRLLIDEMEFEQKAEKDKSYILADSEEKMRRKIPFVQTSLLVIEAINLEPTWNKGILSLSEPRTGTKDRIVTLGYANYIASKLENKLLKKNQEDEFDISEWKIIF